MSNIINTTRMFLDEILSDDNGYCFLIDKDDINIYNTDYDLVRKINKNVFLDYIFSKINCEYEFI